MVAPALAQPCSSDDSSSSSPEARAAAVAALTSAVYTGTEWVWSWRRGARQERAVRGGGQVAAVLLT